MHTKPDSDFPYPEELSVFKQAFNCSKDSILVIDPFAMKIVDANESASDCLGYSKEELLQLSPADIDAVFDHDTLSKAFANIISSAEQQATFPTKYKRKDASTFDAEVYLCCYKEKEVCYILATATQKSILKKAQEDLEFNATLFKNISDAVISTNENFIITSWNKYAEEIFGFSKEEATGQLAHRLIDIKYVDSTFKKVLEFLFANGWWKGEIIAGKKNGERFAASTSIGLVRDDNGNIIGTVSVVKDITETKNIEKKLKEFTVQLERQVLQKTEELNQVFSRITDGFIAYDTNWNHVYINGKAAEIIGLDPTQIIGKSIWNLFPELVETPLYENYMKAMKEQTVLRMEFLNPLSQEWFEGSMYPSPEGLSVFFTEITSKKKTKIALEESEFRYRTIVETAQEGIWQTDENNQIIFVNNYLTNLLGYSCEEMLGKSATAFFASDNSEAMILQKNNRCSHQYALTLLNRWGEQVFTLLRSQPVYKEERFAGTISTILNITRQKEDEAKLQASEKRFKALFQNSSDGIALLSKDDIIVEVSPSAENITGLSKEELINRARADLGICEHLETTRETLEEVIANPLIIKKAEHEIVTPQGDRKWLEFTYSNLLDEPGVGAVVLNFRDITGRKKQEIQLRESEARLIEAQALAKIGSWEIDLHDGATKWSPEIFRIFETDPEQLIASRHQFLELVHPHDREKLNEAFDRSLKLKGHNVLQHRIVTASGNEKIVLQHWQVFYNDEMVPMRMSGTCQDRTGQVKAEEDNKFKANLLNTVGQAVVATDLDGLITYWNKAAEDIYGWSAAEATGKNIIDLLPAAQSREQARQIMHDLRIGKVWSNEFEVQRKDGSQFCAFVTDSPIYDQHGQLAGMIGVSSDTSERKKIETELKESEARYKTAQKLGKLGHWELDLHNNSVLWSGELYNIFQLDPATTIPRFETVFRFLHPGDEKALKHHVDLTLAGLKPNDSVFKITLDNGDVRYVLEMSELKKDAAGRPLKIVGTVQDVTDQKLTENALVLSEKKYKLLFEENPVPLFMFKESSLEFIEVNHSALQQYGYLKDEFLKMNLNNIIPEKQRVELNELIENHTSESKFEDTVQHKKKNGEVIYTKISTHRILYNQQPVWLSAARDITPEITYEQKLKESQEQLSLIYNNTIDAMWLLSVEDNGVYRFLNINNAYTHLTGAQKQDVVGRQLEEVVPKEHLARLKEKYNDTVNTKNVATFFTTTGLSNSEITAEIRVIPIINEKGVVEQLLGIGNDVTERQKSRKSLVKMNLQLRELTFHLQNVREEERTSIAREIHDELGQQLTVLKMNVAWVKRKMGEQDELIVNKLKETLELCDFTITTIRKIASNLRPSIIDDLGLVAAIEWQCEEFSKRSGVPVNFSSDVNNLKFKPDASIALFRILQEALTNVARHANATNITCTLKKQGGNITLTIIDNGRGFDLSGKRKVKTLGILGMTERAAMINGTYKISSVPNKGTTVSVQIPLKGL